MTSIAGYTLAAAPCCRKIYSIPRYRSMNFSASEYWTDGYADGRLMPGGYGLRKCVCGAFYLASELLELVDADESKIDFTSHAQPEDLPQAIATARHAEVELAARLEYWHELNHAYRQSYRAHRDAEEAATQAAWELANPDSRSFWQKLRKEPAPAYTRPPNSPFTYPPFEPSPVQKANMRALLQLLESLDKRESYLQEIIELHRELGEFDEAAKALDEYEEKDRNRVSKLLSDLVQGRERAPVRYRL
ncbi:MAG: hypothetical protein RIR68_449 [Pseudomonadota bacterium]|jgi:hypothetical protein